MRLPPYGKDVEARPENVFIYAGANAWTSALLRAATVGRNSVMVLPYGESFAQYRWPVSGHELVLIWPDGSLPEVRAFGEHLVRSGAALVVAPHEEDPENALYIKPVRKAA
jgi:hypothetical protein